MNHFRIQLIVEICMITISFLCLPKNIFAQVCQDSDGICSTSCTPANDSDCLITNWPVSNPDTNTIWDNNGALQQLMTKNSQYWYSSTPGSNNWTTGTISVRDINLTNVPLPTTLDTNAVFPFAGKFGQTETKGNNWWFRPDTTGPWTNAGTLFTGEQNQTICPFPSTLNTNTVFPSGGGLTQVGTYNNTFWSRTSTSGPWTSCGVELPATGITPLRTQTNFPFRGSTAELLTQDTHFWLYSDKLSRSFFSFDLSGASSQTSPLMFGTNLTWPFFQFNTQNNDLSDSTAKHFLSDLSQSAFFRFPGGHWSEWYHWYEAIGTQPERPWRAIVPAGLPLPNNFGTSEYISILKRTNTNEAMFTVNYLSGTANEASKWVEFVSGIPPSPVPSNWTTNDWRTFVPVVLTQSISATDVTFTVQNPQAFGYTFTKAEANCDNYSVDGYGQDTAPVCEQNKYEYQKKSLRVGNEWMVVDAVEGNTLTVRRGTGATSHQVSETAGFWQYNIESMPTGYFAWLRSQPGYGGNTLPFTNTYWEVSNEPFFASVRGGSCNHLEPCVLSKADPLVYAAYFNLVATQIYQVNPQVKVGLPIQSNFEFTGVSSGNSWSIAVIGAINDKSLIKFVTPHFYQGFAVPQTNGDNFSLVAAGPDQIYRQISSIKTWLTTNGITAPLLPNEYAVVYHTDGAYGWWSQLGPAAGLWRDGLYLSSLLIRYMETGLVSGANYWHLYWPGLLGKTGTVNYPYGTPNGGDYLSNYSQVGAAYPIFSYLSAYLLSNIYLPLIQTTNRVSSTSFGNTVSAQITDPLLVTAFASSDKHVFTIAIVNRSTTTQPIRVKLQNTADLSSVTPTEIMISGNYTDLSPQTTINKLNQSLTLIGGSNSLEYIKDVPPTSVILLSNKPVSVFDINVDGNTDATDIKLILQNWLSTNYFFRTDLLSDTVINALDFAKFLGH